MRAQAIDSGFLGNIASQHAIAGLADSNRYVVVIPETSGGVTRYLRLYLCSSTFTPTPVLIYSVDVQTTTIGEDSGTRSITQYAITADGQNNLHLAWTQVSSTSPVRADAVRYVKLTKGSGFSWTAGSIENVFRAANASATNYMIFGCSIAVHSETGNGYPTIAATMANVTISSGTVASQGIRVFSKNSSNVWANDLSSTVQASNSISPGQSISIVRATSATYNSKIRYIIMSQHLQESDTAHIFVVRTDVTTNANPQISGSSTRTMARGFAPRICGFNGAGGDARFGVKDGGDVYVVNVNLLNSGANDASHSATENGRISCPGTFATWSKTLSGNLVATTIHNVYSPSFHSMMKMLTMPFGGTYWVEEDWSGIYRFTSGASGPYYGGASRISTTREEFVAISNTTASDRRYAIVNDTPPAPTSLSPTSGSTTASEFPIFSATRPVFPGWSPALGFYSLIEHQVANNSTMTSGLKTKISDGINTTDGGTVATRFNTSNIALALGSGTKYHRARQVDALGNVSPWSSVVSFTNTHPPSASSLSPASGAVVAWGTGTVSFSWTFTDPNTYFEGQTAYQLVVERNSDGSVIFDSGKVISSNNSGSAVIPSGYKDIQLRWKVRLWDMNDTVGSYSAYALFIAADGPTITITAPGSTVDNPQPTVTWTYFSGRGAAQARRLMQILEMPSETILYTSAWSAGTSTSMSVPSGILQNGKDYRIKIFAQDTGNLEGSGYKDVTTAWVPPGDPVFSVDPFEFDKYGRVAINWSNFNIDLGFLYWQVRRREHGVGVWETIGTVQQSASGNYTFHDWLIKDGQGYDYVVVQVADRYGAPLASSGSSPVSVTPIGGHFWLLHPYDENLNVRLSHVKSFDDEESYEESTLNLINQGRKVEYGTRWGLTGTIEAHVRSDQYMGKTARQFKLELEALRKTRSMLYLRTPFGDLYKVSASNISRKYESGTGTEEVHSVTIPWTEISSVRQTTDTFNYEDLYGPDYAMLRGILDGGSPS